MRKIRKISDNTAVDNIINFAPFVDLLFVIILILIIPNQVMFGNIKVDIPKGNADLIVVQKDPVVVFIKNDGSIFVNEEEVKLNQLGQRLIETTMKDYSTKIFIIGDKKNLYERVISVVDKINTAGFTDAVLITDLNQDLNNNK